MKNLLFIICLAAGLFSCSKDDSSTGTTLSLPNLSTTSATSITTTTARVGGNIGSDGGAAVTARGICWGINPNPNITGIHTIEGTGIGIFQSTLTGLTATTVYYARSYATNSVGTSYGNQVSFITNAPVIVLPTLTTTAITAIGATFATSGGSISSDGGAAVTARGVCWSTSTNPVATGSHTTDGTGTGTFVSSITGLTTGVTYFVRAYATNSEGTAYGNEVSFTPM